MTSARRSAQCGLVAASVVFLAAVSIVLSGTMEKPNLRIGLPGSPAASFCLPDHQGSIVSLSSLRGSVGVMYFAPDPDSKLCAHDIARLSELARDYGSKDAGVKLLTIFHNTDDMNGEQLHQIRNHAADAGPGCVILMDPNGRIASRYKVDHTPTFFVIDPNGIIRYRGGIDDRSPDAPLATSFNHLIDLLLAEKPLPSEPAPAVLSNINK